MLTKTDLIKIKRDTLIGVATGIISAIILLTFALV
jgi:hypothetical protein